MRESPTPLRRSEGGIALIERIVGGSTEWLAQWNEKWQAFFFVGGHREPSESFRDCVAREIADELGLADSQFTVAAEPAHHLEYRAQSRSSGTLTEYVMELFPAHLAPGSAERIANDPVNTWLGAEEILRLEAHDGRPISTTMRLLLMMTGRIG